ncbi:hypothetical protein PS712_01171 [Pseudomonas fluorescens]|uniref:Uncharacterized protein n=1 Tax=Pseudomonas fluorescens TaxID=294 RepID=A0A5E7B4W5_PSEFL|nr:hypothetical protein PS712_01171 [Pseudomonas fluorescens]
MMMSEKRTLNVICATSERLYNGSQPANVSPDC